MDAKVERYLTRICFAPRPWSQRSAARDCRIVDFAGYAYFLNCAHALAYQNLAKIGRAGDIVSDGAEENGIFSSSSPLLPGYLLPCLLL